MAVVLSVIILALYDAYTSEPEPAPPPANRVVLLPGADGQAGAVVIKSAGGETVLDRPYAAVEVSGKGVVAMVDEDAAGVRKRYGATLDAQPQRPATFTVYFITDSDELTADSRQTFEQIKVELVRRPVPDIVVIGHTDRVGTVEYNDQLSRKRADTVRAALVAAGIAVERIQIAGRGEREPLVPTADEVEEPRNRRVEINVR